MPPATIDAWPDAVDGAAILIVTALFVGLPLLGHVLLTQDIRAYYRRLRNALVVARGYVTALPEWVRRDAPPCIAEFGLTLPCTESELLAAYREKVKHAHPDAGGSRRDFARLQKHFEEAMSLAMPDR